MTCPNMHLWNFWLDVNTIRETEVPTMQKEKIQEYQNPGFIIKGATNIILNTGLITVSIVAPSSKASQCRRRYVAEMIMDRISASRVYLGDAYTDQAPYQYLKKGIGHLWFVHPETLSQLEFLLRMLSERGEDDTLYYIRYHFLKGDPVPRMHCPQECTVYEEAIRKKVSPSTH